MGLDHVTCYDSCALLGLWSFRLSLCFQRQVAVWSPREGVLLFTDSNGYQITSINQEYSCIPADKSCTNTDLWSHMVALLFTCSRKPVKHGRLCESSDLTGSYALARLTWQLITVIHWKKNNTNKAQNTQNLNPESAFVNYSANTRLSAGEQSKLLFVIILET